MIRLLYNKTEVKWIMEQSANFMFCGKLTFVCRDAMVCGFSVGLLIRCHAIDAKATLFVLSYGQNLV